MNILSEIILPIAPFLGMLLFFNSIIGVTKIRIYRGSFLPLIRNVCCNYMHSNWCTFI